MERRHGGRVRAAARLALLIALAQAAGSRTAAAHPLDTYGAGPRAAALGSALTAQAEGALAAHYNPAGAGAAAEPELSVAFTHHRPALRVNGADWASDPLSLWHIGLAGPLPGSPQLARWVGYALSVALPQSGIYELRQPDDRALGFPLLEGRNRRLVLAGSLSVRPLPWLRLGMGVGLLPQVPGRVIIDLSDSEGVSSTEIDIDYDWSPRLGLQAALPAGLELGLALRRGHEMALGLPVEVVVTEGFPVSAAVEGPAYGTPDRATLGLSWRPDPAFLLLGDLGWYRFSSLGQESPTVTILDGAGRVSSEFTVSDPKMRDVWVPQLGAEFWPRPWLALRAGWAYHPSPLPAQTGVSNLLDAARHIGSLGLGLRWTDLGPWGPSRLELDLYGQVQRLTPLAWEKDSVLVGNQGYPTVTAAGQVYSSGLGLTVTP